jgi:hypothetical protein
MWYCICLVPKISSYYSCNNFFFKFTIIVERLTEWFAILLVDSNIMEIRHSVFFAVLLCVFTFWLPCCDVRYDFNMITMFNSSLSPVVWTHVLFTLFVFVYIKCCPTHIVLCFDMLVIVLCTLCCFGQVQQCNGV